MKWLWSLLLFFVCINVDNPSRSFAVSDTVCLKAVVEHEASGESLAGKRAVMDVVLERMKRTNKSCPVVALQPKQFSGFTWQKIIETKSLTGWEELSRMSPVCAGCSHFHRLDKHPEWNKKFKHRRTIGLHKFYMEET